MRRAEIRLGCLQLAAERQGAKDPRSLIEIADELVAWVEADKEGPVVRRQQKTRS